MRVKKKKSRMNLMYCTLSELNFGLVDSGSQGPDPKKKEEEVVLHDSYMYHTVKQRIDSNQLLLTDSFRFVT